VNKDMFHQQSDSDYYSVSKSNPGQDTPKRQGGNSSNNHFRPKDAATSGISLASGCALIGSSIAGPAGGIFGAIAGAAAGVYLGGTMR